MPVRKTESRLPTGFAAADLGESGIAPDGRCALVSFVTAPLVLDRENAYVLLVTDAGLAVSAASYEWTFTLGDAVPEVQVTTVGEIAYQPADTGLLAIQVRILDAASNEQASLEMNQVVVSPSMDLEAMIAEAVEQAGAGAGDPDTLRELVNEHARYYQATKPATPEAGDAFGQFLFRLAFDGVSRRTVPHRKQQLGEVAAAVNDGGDFAGAILEGLGVCGIRISLLAMLPAGGGPPPLAWTELPEARNERGFAAEQLGAKVAALNESVRIDLFNLVRFPKSNIAQCGRILESLRDHYFAGASFKDVLEGMSGTRAHWIARHFLEGPLKRS
jgi:hypothetical protein